MRVADLSTADAFRTTLGPSFGISSSLHFIKSAAITAQSLWGYRPAVRPPSGHAVADDPAYIVEFALPPPFGRLRKIDHDLGSPRSGWKIDVTTQGTGWYREEEGVFDADMIVERIAIPILDVWRAPVKAQDSPPSTALVDKHRRFIQNGHGLLAAFGGRLGTRGLTALGESLIDEGVVGAGQASIASMGGDTAGGRRLPAKDSDPSARWACIA